MLMTSRSITRLNNDSFLYGVYIKEKANNKAKHGIIKFPLETSTDEALIKAAIKIRYTTWRTTIITENICICVDRDDK
jgi:hypothetical protein